MASDIETLDRAGESGVAVPETQVFSAIVLNYRNAWEGMMLTVFDPEKGSMIEDANGQPLRVIILLGGTDTVRPGLYKLNAGLYNQDGNGDVPTAGQVELDGGSLYFPTEIFSPESAPPSRTYAVFNDGESLRFNDGNGARVWGHTNDKRMFEPENIPRNMKKEDFVLPKTAVLIRLHESFRPETRAFWGMGIQRA